MTPVPYPSLLIRFTAEGVEGRASALLDTGFDGHLAIPETVVPTLPRPLYRRRVRTASGQIVRVAAYLGTVELDDRPSVVDSIIIALGDEYLLGLSVLNRFKVTFDHGRRVIVEP